MVAVEQPDAGCGHDAALRQQCGRCLRWCCPSCYSPWMALACTSCRVAAAVAVITVPVAPVEARPEIEIIDSGRTACRDRSRPRSLPVLAQRIAELERRVEELRYRP